LENNLITIFNICNILLCSVYMYVIFHFIIKLNHTRNAPPEEAPVSDNTGTVTSEVI
jgi:hypothetical protein